MELFEQHLSESKILLERKAQEILLTKADYEGSKIMFAPLKKVLNNVIISDHLLDLANDRVASFRNLSNNSEEGARYKDEVCAFLRRLVRNKL
ncbi:MAG: hypothetical protein RL204_1123 [Bacteroidota bacterium]|jgi:3'-phosphoadenosine 5'-phosphosulfate (PAPS) 3'-phosphatase